jgi:signal transduction histidine kinase
MSLGLISDGEIKKKLASIFVDSIILTGQFEIALISKNVLETLGFRLAELKGKSINYLSKDDNLQGILVNELNSGFFEEAVISLNTKHNEQVLFSISGFYLGLISDLNGYIILKLKNLDEVKALNSKLESNREELDRFIYRTAHDLRGPLATIRGLINLLKIRTDNSEVDNILSMLDVNADRLDERLFKLLYLAESGETCEHCGTLSCADLEASLRQTLVSNFPMELVSFHFYTPQPDIDDLQEHLVTSLLNNLLLYIISLPRNYAHQIDYSLRPAQDGLDIKIKVDGFITGASLQHMLRHKASSVYADMLTFPQLVNYYAAQKIAIRLNAHIRVIFMSHTQQEITVFIPFLD